MTTRRARPGFTLTEVMVAMTLMLFVLGVATNSFRKQSGLIAAQSGRLEAQQTAQFTLSELDRELRLAGVGVADMQPVVVQADSLAVTFNADLISTVPEDPSAVYIDPDADPDQTTVWRSADKRTLPRSGFYYPDSTHMRSVGAPSGAETISYWLSRDSSATATNEYVLFRRVNHNPARVVAKGIIRNPTDTIFQYFKGDSLGNLSAIPTASLPMYHNASTHGVKADTGRFAWVDSIRTIRVRMTVVFQDRKGPVYRRLEHTIRLMNAGLVRRSTCGEPPITSTPTAAAALDTAGFPFVTITFPQSADEAGGERDVERYALYRRLNGEATTGAEPFASIPAGSSSYTFKDTDVISGQVWSYGVASQDCTPQISNVSYSAAVTIP
jgi:prepilin-type N-terminal cleavage/methylation domain-containing protein